MNNKRILVIGATGQQGGSVVKALFNKGHEIFGLTRKPDSERAKALAAKNVNIVFGDLHDNDSLTRAFKQVDSVFLVVTPFEAGVEYETAQGINAIDVARDVGISHLVYSSVSDADKSTGIPHFDSKFKIEQHLVESGVPFTIIAPTSFYDNMMAPFILPGLQDGTLARAMPAEVLLQSVSVKNIGDFAKLILENRNRFLGKRINIAGDELDGPRYAEVIGAASGRQISYFEVPIEKVRESSEDMALMYEWFNSVGYSVDIEGLKREYPEVDWETFSKWVGRQDWSVLEKS